MYVSNIPLRRPERWAERGVLGKVIPRLGVEKTPLVTPSEQVLQEANTRSNK
jgi:hypothetical protein